MTQNASIPSWAKLLIGSLCAVFFLYMWAMAASKLFLVFLFKGSPPFEAQAFTVFQYLVEHGGNKRVVMPAVTSILATGVAFVGFPLLLLVPKRAKLHGEAHFAGPREIKAMGLDGDDGILVGKYGKRFLLCPDQNHVMLSAPTGSGKGTGAVIPNLLSWNHSVICLDIKKENYRLTSKFREAHGHKVFLFDPGDSERRTHRWNPLGYVREDHAQRIDDIQKIAQQIYPDIDGSDPIWTGGCRSLFLGLGLFIFETPGMVRTMGAIAREAYGLDDDALKSKIDSRAKAGNPYSIECELALRDYLKAPEKTRESIRKTFTGRLELFMNPVIDAATSDNDFNLEQLRRERITIYIGITPDNLGRMAPLLNLFFQQVLDVNLRVLPEHDPSLKFQLLLLMDEFVAMGKMQTLLDSIAFIRGFNIRLMPIFQSPMQVEALYGKAHALGFFQNHTCRMIYEPADYETAEAVSKELGTDTVTKWSKSKPLFGGKGGSQSESEQGRSLMLAQELTTMGGSSLILLIRGQVPVKCDKIFYFKDHVFLDRLKSISPTLASADNTWINRISVKLGLGIIKKNLPSRDQFNAAQFGDELSTLPPPVAKAPRPQIDRPADTRPSRKIELEDLDKLESIPLADFNADFSGIEIPPADCDEEDLEAFADQVYRRCANSS